jgi:hypothetical protein
MTKGPEKSSPCMLSRHVVFLGILKWTRMRESSLSILKLDKGLRHLRNLRVNLNITKMQNLYKCTKGVVAKLSHRRQTKQLQTMIW